MSKMTIQAIALILMLLAVPLTSIGTTNDLLWVSIIGLAVITVGGLVPPVLKFVPLGDDEDES